MASGKPIVRQVAWLSILAQLVVILIFIAIYKAMDIREPIIIGAITYLLFLISLRYFLPLNHRKGISAFKKGDYESALPHFEKSYEYFKNHKWIDKWRYLVLLSSSRISYREMALLNMAFCYGQMKQGDEAITTYKRTLVEFPGSEMAIAALNMIEAVSNNTEQGD